MLQHRGKGVGAKSSETEGVVAARDETGYGIGCVAPKQTTGTPGGVAVGDEVHPPRGVLIARSPPHLHCRRAKRVHPQRGCRTRGDSRRDWHGVQSHDITTRHGCCGGGRGNIGQTHVYVPRINDTPLVTIELAPAPTIRAVRRYNQVAEAGVVERRIELVVIPAHGTDQRVDQHLLEHGAEAHHPGTHAGHVGVGQIDGASGTAHAARRTAVEVDTCNHRLSVQLAFIHQLLGITGREIQAGQSEVAGCQIHVRRVTNEDGVRAWCLPPGTA